MEDNSEDADIPIVLALLNTKLALRIFQITNPTLNFQVKNIRDIPYRVPRQNATVTRNTNRLIELSTNDWDFFETSPNFKQPQILSHKNKTLSESYDIVRDEWHKMTKELQTLEEDNNLLFAEAYNLGDELASSVELGDVSLLVNPHYRYGNDREETELETRLLSDTMKEFISYAVGCMFGRFSLDKPGLVLANQGEGLKEYLELVPKPTFMPDADNIIPIQDDEYFTDDIVERFREFLRIAFGTDNYEDNLIFIEQTIGKDIRKYFLSDFSKDHIKRYKKRPIYWMFSSPKRSFNVLIYMHRYRPDTISTILNDYLRVFISKLG